MRYRLISLLALTLLVSACQKPLSNLTTKPIPQPLPYHFTISSILDTRAIKNPHENLNAHPFNRNDFAQGLQNNLPRTLFATHKAKLQAELVEYTTTMHNNVHALSYALTLMAYDSYNRIIAPRETYTCSKTAERGFYAHKLAESAYKGESLSNAAQSAKLFQSLINACLTENMAAFQNAVVRNAE